MTELEKEEYLTRKGWVKVNRIHWVHDGIMYRCKTEVALLIQLKKDKESA